MQTVILPLGREWAVADVASRVPGNQVPVSPVWAARVLVSLHRRAQGRGGRLAQMLPAAQLRRKPVSRVLRDHPVRRVPKVRRGAPASQRVPGVLARPVWVLCEPVRRQNPSNPGQRHGVTIGSQVVLLPMNHAWASPSHHAAAVN